MAKENKDKKQESKKQAQDCTSNNADRSFPKKNDAKWYYSDATQLKNVAKITTGYALGSEITANSMETGPFPGILSTYVIPGVGISLDNNAPVGVAASDLHAQLRLSNASNYKVYDKADSMLTVLGVINAHIPWLILRRLYGVAHSYIIENKYWPAQIIRSMGFNPNGLKKKLSSIREWLDAYALDLATLPAPGNLPYSHRLEYLFSNVFTDNATPTAQKYVVNPYVIYKWQGFTENGTTLIPHIYFMNEDGTPKIWDVDDFMDAADQLPKILRSNSDVDVIYNDVKRTFAGKLYTLPYTPETYVTPVVTDTEYLFQLSNATILPPAIHDDSLNIGQSVREGAIIFNPKFKGNASINQFAGPHMVNFPYSDPTEEDIMEVTRFNAFATYDPGSGSLPNQEFRVNTASEMIMCGMLVWDSVSDDARPTAWIGGSSALVLRGSNTISIDYYELLKQYMTLTSFKYRPMGFVWEYSETLMPKRTNASLVDWDTYGYLEEKSAKAMNRIAICTMLGVTNSVNVTKGNKG